MAGATMTAAMMYEAVTGTASPSIRTANAEYSTVRKSCPPAKATMSPAIFRPSPVSVTVPTMIPAVAVVAATGRTLLPPVVSASKSLRGPSAFARSTKLRPMAISIE